MEIANNRVEIYEIETENMVEKINVTMSQFLKR